MRTKQLIIIGIVLMAASLMFARPVFADWEASGKCNVGDFYTQSDSKDFPDEASCREYLTRGNNICYDFGAPSNFIVTFTLTEDCHQLEPTCGANEYASNGQCFCNDGYSRINNRCITLDQWCQDTYGANVHGEGDQCVCDAGYNFLGKECVTQDEGCQAKYGPNIHGEGDQCTCDTGYSFLDNKCVTKDELCQTKYGENIHADGDNCNCDDGYGFLNNACMPMDQYCPLTHGENSHNDENNCYCNSGYVFNEQDICVPEPVSPPPTNSIDNTSPPPIYIEPPRKISEDEKAVILEWARSRGFGPEDIKKIDPADMWYFSTTPLFKELQSGRIKAEEKYNKADAVLSQAFADGSIGDPATLENIRKMFLDAWFDNPNNKKTNLMMAMLEREKGNDQTADIFQRFAYSTLSQSQRDILFSGTENAKIMTYDDIFSSMETEKRQQEVARTWQMQQLQKSSLMNQMKEEINYDISSAQKATKKICTSIGPCDWAYAETVEISTKAQGLSQKVRDLMNDPLKTAFGIDVQKMIKDLGGQESTNEKQ